MHVVGAPCGSASNASVYAAESLAKIVTHSASSCSTVDGGKPLGLSYPTSVPISSKTTVHALPPSVGVTADSVEYRRRVATSCRTSTSVEVPLPNTERVRRSYEYTPQLPLAAVQVAAALSSWTRRSGGTPAASRLMPPTSARPPPSGDASELPQPATAATAAVRSDALRVMAGH